MHELSIAEHLIEAAESAARRAGACTVRRVCLRLGELSGVDESALRFAFAVVVQGTLLDGAALDVAAVAPAMRCAACGGETDSLRETCGICGSSRVIVVRGRELELASMEIDVPDVAAASHECSHREEAE
jgi:hydrogenase nickel incorporation protein HypA/HybF